MAHTQPLEVNDGVAAEGEAAAAPRSTDHVDAFSSDDAASNEAASMGAHSPSNVGAGPGDAEECPVPPEGLPEGEQEPRHLCAICRESMKPGHKTAAARVASARLPALSDAYPGGELDPVALQQMAAAAGFKERWLEKALAFVFCPTNSRAFG